MKKVLFILIILNLCATNAKAQDETRKPISVKGYFNENYRNVYLSNEVKYYLFLKCEGWLPQEDDFYQAYFVDLDSVSAAKLQREVILIISTEGYRNYGKEVWETEVLPLHPTAPHVYYTKGIFDLPIEERRKNPYYSFWENPLAKDTLVNLIVGTEDNLLPFYINALGIKDSIRQESIQYTVTKTDCTPNFLYPAINIEKLAREGLKNVQRLYKLNPPKREAPAAIWKKWYAEIPKKLKLKDVTKIYNGFVTRPTEYKYQDLFTQRGDSIFGFFGDSVYILNTSTYEFIRTNYGKTLTMKEFPQNSFYEEQKDHATTKKLYSVIKESDYSGKWRYVRQRNGDIVVARIQRTDLQLLLRLQILKAGTNQLTQGIVVDTMIPINEDDFFRLKVVGLYETKDKYVVISRVGLTRCWYLIDKKELL